MSNAFGGTGQSVATLTVKVETTGDEQTVNIVNITVNGNDASVRFAGIPGRVYNVQGTEDLLLPAWTHLGVTQIGPLGFSIFIDTNAPPIRFYRTGRTATHSLGYGDNGFDITFSPGGNDVHNYQTFSYTLDSEDRLSGTWGADGRNTDPDLVLDTDSRSALLDSFTGLNPNGNWTLFVADLSQNGKGVIEEWGLDIAAVPEPASLSLVFAGFLCAWVFRRVHQYIST